ncbi:MAG TPA: hypothetical protein VGX23_15310 [Actinocrinis sp.]|nr:hypothetical protein [Actinocrinis sp.]
MSDLFELTVTFDLRDELGDQELAELRWHLGLGPQPESLTIVTEFPVVELDDSAEPMIFDEPVIFDDPSPLLAESGAAWRVGGALCSALFDWEGEREVREGWALTCRQDLHPDSFERPANWSHWQSAQTP